MSVIKAWQTISPWWRVRMAVDHNGRCYRSFQDLSTPYKWQPWEAYRTLDIDDLPDDLDGCPALVERNNWRKWQFPTC